MFLWALLVCTLASPTVIIWLSQPHLSHLTLQMIHSTKKNGMDGQKFNNENNRKIQWNQKRKVFTILPAFPSDMEAKAVCLRKNIILFYPILHLIPDKKLSTFPTSASRKNGTGFFLYFFYGFDLLHKDSFSFMCMIHPIVFFAECKKPFIHLFFVIGIQYWVIQERGWIVQWWPLTDTSK